ncbi:hypothetical protein [Collimonas sp.]|jgi:hypothetical protein|nr:hypothetical protein [Collimonas sp.]HWX03986.1 hypothetical protein [Collimonas sp.]
MIFLHQMISAARKSKKILLPDRGALPRHFGSPVKESGAAVDGTLARDRS